MSMKHTYFTGLSLGTKVQYSSLGGTDSLSLQVTGSTGTFAAVSNSSTYGSTAVQVTTTATTSQDASFADTNPSGQTERRASVIVDMPTMTSGQTLNILSVSNTGGSFGISLSQSGAWSVSSNGSTAYQSSTGLLPTAGTRLRIAYAVGINGTSSTWRACIYNDTTGVAIDTERTGTTSWSGTFWTNNYYGKVNTSSAASVTITFRGIRVENGGGCAAALLPAETSLSPAEGANIVPIRIVANTGTAINPTGATAVTNLSDANDTTTVTVPTGSTMRVALRPMSVVGPYLTFNLYKALLTAAGTISVNLYSGNGGTQIGTTKTVNLTTSAADATVTFSSSEISGLTSTDWESMELELIVP